MWQLFIAELREVLWLASIICGLSILGVAFSVAMALSGAMPALLSPF